MNEKDKQAMETAWKEHRELPDPRLLSMDKLGFEAGFTAALAHRDAQQWRVIYTEKDYPTEYGWYLVSVLELNDLGGFRYTDILSFGHREGIGGCWFIQSDKQTVVAWRERPAPYAEPEPYIEEAL